MNEQGVNSKKLKIKKTQQQKASNMSAYFRKFKARLFCS